MDRILWQLQDLCGNYGPQGLCGYSVCGNLLDSEHHLDPVTAT